MTPAQKARQFLQAHGWSFCSDDDKACGGDGEGCGCDYDVAILAALLTEAAAQAVAAERVRLGVMLGKKAWECGPGPVRMALAIAERDVRRGRRLSAGEQMDNLAAALRESPQAEPTAEGIVK